MNVVLSGLTAAGKTTHARLLAERLGYRYVSASQVLASLAGIEIDPRTHWWLERGGDLSRAREGHVLDRELDRRMVALTAEADQQVFDAWALPWISSEPMLRIWLESDRPSRCRKCQVSHAPLNPVSFAQAGDIVDEKDSESRRIFLELHGFDLFHPPDVFDVHVDLSMLIPQASMECATEGISRADAFLGEFVLAKLSHGDASSAKLAATEAAMPPDSVVYCPD